MTLTEAGRRVLLHADAIADRLAAAEQDLAALAGLESGRVRVAAFPTAAAVLLPPVLAATLRPAPGLEVHLIELEPPEAEAAVRDGTADLALVFRHEQDAAGVEGDLLRQPLTRDPALAVVPASREDGPAELAELAELARERWIAGCARCRAHLLRCAAKAGFVPDVRFATDDHVVTQRLVAAGLGVALLPKWALEQDRRGNAGREGTPMFTVVPGEVSREASSVSGSAGSLLDELAREGARRMLAAALEGEVAAYIEEHSGALDANGHRLVVRNGRAVPRSVTTSAGAIEVHAPRVNDKRTDEATGERVRFSSAILPAWCRRSPQVTEVLPLLYLHGLSSSDFVPALGQFPRLHGWVVRGHGDQADADLAGRGRRPSRRGIFPGWTTSTCGLTGSMSPSAWRRRGCACWC